MSWFSSHRELNFRTSKKKSVFDATDWQCLGCVVLEMFRAWNDATSCSSPRNRQKTKTTRDFLMMRLASSSPLIMSGKVMNEKKSRYTHIYIYTAFVI